MADRIKDVLDSFEHGGINTDLTRMDDLEINLTELAQAVSMADDPVTACMGRALKYSIPAWAGFIRHEQQRNDPQGPGTSVFSLVRVYAMLTSILTLGVIKPDHPDKQGMVELVSQLFTHDMSQLVGKAEEVPSDESATRH